MEMRDDGGRTGEGVYRIDPDGRVTRVLGRELERPNGLLVSADDRFLYVADNNNNTAGGARKLYRFALRQDGTVAFTWTVLGFPAPQTAVVFSCPAAQVRPPHAPAVRFPRGSPAVRPAHRGSTAHGPEPPRRPDPQSRGKV